MRVNHSWEKGQEEEDQSPKESRGARQRGQGVQKKQRNPLSSPGLGGNRRGDEEVVRGGGDVGVQPQRWDRFELDIGETLRRPGRKEDLRAYRQV